MSLRVTKQRIIAFDPGVTTGVAVLDSKGNIINTMAVNERLVVGNAKRLRRKYHDVKVVIEQGPLWRSDSQLTRTVEGELRNIFPDAVLIPPNRWKGHPAAKCTERMNTTHERDAVRLGRWFLARSNDNGESHQEDTT
jgi:hypothetical protein